MSERPAGATDGRAGEPAAASPHEEVRDFFYRRENHLHDTDLAAERPAAEIGTRPGGVIGALTARLAQAHGEPPATGPHAPASE